MNANKELLLVSPDLMATSRIAGLAHDVGLHIETLRNLSDSPKGGPFSYVLIDLQSVPGDVADIVDNNDDAVWLSLPKWGSQVIKLEPL